MMRKIPEDTKYFKFYNANPKNKKTSDCVLRAICTALNQTWEQTLDDLVEVAKKYKLMVDDDACYKRYLKSKGWIIYKQPRKQDNTKYTGEEFCDSIINNWPKDSCLDYSRVIAHIGGHHIVAIIDGKILDTWNSSYKTVGNYWVKLK